MINKPGKKRKLPPTDDSAMKVMYLAITEASKRCTMPIRNWKAELNRFMIDFERRLINYVLLKRLYGNIYTLPRTAGLPVLLVSRRLPNLFVVNEHVHIQFYL